MATLPKISITSNNSSESSESSSNDNDMNYDRNNDCLTDVEDIDSQNLMPSIPSGNKICDKLLTPKSVNSDNDATDIEDYDDSEIEDDMSQIYPELKISLNEFLKNGLEEKSLINNGIKEHIEIKPGDFIRAQTLNHMADYLTDCEDYYTDSEGENPVVKSVCIDLANAMGDQSKICIMDMAHTDEEEDESYNNADVSVLSDMSDLASALSCVSADEVHGLSENEVLEMSGTEEVCQIEYSGSSNEDDYNESGKLYLTPVEVKFFHTNAQLKSPSMPCNNAFLVVQPCTEEVLTDIEKLDDSAGEEYSFDSEDDNVKPIPRAIILATGEDGESHTDVEDITCEDSTNYLDQPSYVVNSCELPPVHREVVILKEDSNGDTITNVMPMDVGYTFGMCNNQKEEALTDSEEYSCTEDCERKGSIATPSFFPCHDCFESELIVSSDILKPFATRKSEIQSNMESITDVEEIFMDGTNRRKKLKSSSLSKVKSRQLGVRVGEYEDGVTDVEDIDLSENGLLPTEKHLKQVHTSKLITTEKDTDVTDDCISDASEGEHLQIDFHLCEFQDKSAIIVHSFQHDNTKNNMCSTQYSNMPININKQQSPHCNQKDTDVEDIQFTSDVDDIIDINKGNNYASANLNDMLNESYTVVYEKTGSTFNVESEKLQIKGMPDSQDAHTDVEYVESDDKEGN